MTDAWHIRQMLSQRRVWDARDFAREERASGLYEELRVLTRNELATRARTLGIPGKLAWAGRQQVIALIIRDQLLMEEDE